MHSVRYRYLLASSVQLIAVSAAITLLLAGGCVWLRHRHDASYPMPPGEFLAQAGAIKPGMGRAQVQSMLKGVSRTQESGNTLVFEMAPRRRTTWAIPLTINMYINVTLDPAGRVIKAWASDG